MVQKNMFKGKAKDNKAAANRHGKLLTQRKGEGLRNSLLFN
jgi:hypothetical protein